jgi:hypothetical protein
LPAPDAVVDPAPEPDSEPGSAPRRSEDLQPVADMASITTSTKRDMPATIRDARNSARVGWCQHARLGILAHARHPAGVYRSIVLFVAGCAGLAMHPRHPSEGTIAGLARDRESGEPIARADIRVRAEGRLAARAATTGTNGNYQVAHLQPGRYSLDAEFAGQPIDIEHIDVHAGGTTLVDVTFTLGQPDRIHVDFGNPQDAAIARYRPRHVAPHIAILEGTVTDAATRAPVVGASVTATAAGTTLQALTDDLGRYRFDAVEPGAYTVSAYYSIGGRGQIEVRRGDIAVGAGDGVVVPLWVELEKE